MIYFFYMVQVCVVDSLFYVDIVLSCTVPSYHNIIQI